MSRCFPFPPPGYEKKIRTDEADSLIKEKQKKEKKHKKEKKDKEKKEGKDSKDRETSKDKHKERKEKHKDRKDKEKSRTSEDKNSAGTLPNTRDREKLGNGESKFIHDLARRIRDEEEATKSQNVGEIRNENEKRINMFKPLEKKDQAKKMELQENNHRKESVTVADMPLDSEELKRSEPKFTNSKEKKTEVINKVGGDKRKDVEGGPKLKERDVDTRNFRVHDLSRASFKNLTSEGNLETNTNGFVCENGSRPNKTQRLVASPVSSVQNGRKFEACQAPLEPVSDLQGKVCNPEVKEHRVNGFMKSQEPKSRPTISSVRVKENGEETSAKKRPHSDLKYLDQILFVPEREELLEVDETKEQEWLFGQPGLKVLKKPKTDSTASVDETLQVWSQALSIDSAGIVALPYVGPF